MVIAACSHVGCPYTTPDGEAPVAAAQLAIHGQSHVAGAGGNATNVKKPDRPDVFQDMSESDWNEFVYNWNNYKRDAKIEGKLEMMRSELQNCCKKEIRSRLFQMKGETGLNAANEADLLAAIKLICVNKLSITQHREQFAKITQENSESPQAHLSRVRSKSTLCNFTVKTMCSQACAGNLEKFVSYAEDVIETQMIAGIANPDHQFKILTEADNHPSLDDKMKLLDLLWTTDKNERAKQDSARQDARSTYKSEKNAPGRHCECGKLVESSNEKHLSCKTCFEALKTKSCACGTKILPSRNCCFKCGKKKKEEKEKEKSVTGMIGAADQTDTYQFCLNAADAASHENSEVEVAVVSGKQRILDRTFGRQQAKKELLTKKTKNPQFPHSKWDGFKFVESVAMPQPMIKTKISVLHDAMSSWKCRVGLQDWDTRIPNKTARHLVPIVSYYEDNMADSGAQVCSITPADTVKLGLKPEDFLPTSMKIYGVGEDKTKKDKEKGRGIVLGCILTEIFVGKRSTRQVMYVMDSPIGTILSREALIELNIISKNFPLPMDDDDAVNINSLKGGVPAKYRERLAKSNEPEVCNCWARTPPPELPTTLPMEATEENREALEAYIKDFFKHNAFNTCYCKPMPVVSGGKMKIHFKKDAEIPKPDYTPAAVPYHYKKATKDLLDRDVAIGVIEKVPEGTPTKFCCRMIMQVKKSGKLRRTIDLQKNQPNHLQRDSLQHSSFSARIRPAPRPEEDRAGRAELLPRCGARPRG